MVASRVSNPPQSKPQPRITPIALPDQGVDCVILFGGSFDPVTLAHVRMSCEARDLAEPGAWMVFVPAAMSPHKDDAPIASDADRVEMLHMATAGVDRCAVWTDEVNRTRAGEPSYSINTVDRARLVLGEAVRLRLLIGADHALSFHRWRESRRILELASPVVLPRGKIATREDLYGAMRASGSWSDHECELWGSWIVELKEMDASSTQVRELFKARELDAAASLIDKRVMALIQERNLYVWG